MGVTSRRLAQLFDPGSFTRQGDAVESHFICGEGRVGAARAFVAMSLGRDKAFDSRLQWPTAQQIIATAERAMASGAPMIYVQDHLGDGRQRFDTEKVLSADMSRLLLSPSGMGRVSAALAELAGRSLLISAILGPTSGPLALPLMIADLVVMTRRGALCMGRPDMVKAMLAQETDLHTLGGADVHGRESGAAHLVYEDEVALFAGVRTLLGLLLGRAGVAYAPPDEADFATLVPACKREPYDVRDLLHAVVDRGSVCELCAGHARELLTAFATLQGRTVAIIANNSRYGGGVLQRASADKMVRMMDLAAKFGIPMAFIADVPGFMIGRDAERSGIFSGAAAIFKAHVRCRVPKLLLVVRKAYTGGVFAMGGGGFRPVATLAYPQAHIGVFSTETFDTILRNGALDAERQQVLAELGREITSPRLLRDKGLLTDVIAPEDTRDALLRYLFPERSPRPGA